jgi:hypothetical protein
MFARRSILEGPKAANPEKSDCGGELRVVGFRGLLWPISHLRADLERLKSLIQRFESAPRLSGRIR